MEKLTPRKLQNIHTVTAVLSPWHGLVIFVAVAVICNYNCFVSPKVGLVTEAVTLNAYAVLLILFQTASASSFLYPLSFLLLRDYLGSKISSYWIFAFFFGTQSTFLLVANSLICQKLHHTLLNKFEHIDAQKLV